MHIGLIAGIGPAATDFYYRGLIERHVAGGVPLDLTMAHADVREMSRNLVGRNPKRQAEIFAGLVDRLKAAGAQAAAITSMGGHFCVNELMAISALPVLNAIPAVDAALARGRFRRIGILGTRTVMETRLYGGIPSVEVVPTEGAALDQVHETYVAMATIGHLTEAQRQVFFEAGRALCARGAEAIMLGGTDLFLAFAGHDPGFPVIDCADIHVDAIYAQSAA
ncbi:MAG: aspartate/glutamate racemase family protein [Reyranella sp.]|uniref:aspartate/glutamate racemase family protein n=1 Tax=Reyranella sp. TaxID=1929291 RepID=UPI0012269A4B|nr:aspartate/glutamate racemase family protein [Reyranella sp.]TAJ92811.1 MAG: aspartate/glutamate racemase family protein [Reyranella sp.]